jgi:hypothetical protein
MAGRGPAPKDPNRRARGVRGESLRVIHAPPTAQPRLPAHTPDGERWPARTVAWWRMWRESPLSADFAANDWSELLDTAVVHARLWSGDVKAAAELRLRVAKFGATPEDRARLRITFAQADEADEKRVAKRTSKPRVLTALSSVGA